MVSPMAGLWGRLANSRWLLQQWAVRDVRTRYGSSVAGSLWVVVQPLLLLGVYGFVFNGFLNVNSGGTPYLLFCGSGLALWAFASGAVSRAAPSLVSAQHLIGKVYFPREVVPLATVLSSLLDLGILLGMLLALIVVEGGQWHLSMLAIPLVLGGLVVVVAAVSVVVATATVFARHLTQALPLVIQLLFIATPVMYPPERVPVRFRWVLDLNPLARSLAAFRDCLFAGRFPGVWTLLLPFALGGLCLTISLRYLALVEARFPDVL